MTIFFLILANSYGEAECCETPDSNPNDVLINSINERIKIVKEEPLNLAAILKNCQQQSNNDLDNDPETTATHLLSLLNNNSNHFVTNEVRFIDLNISLI